MPPQATPTPGDDVTHLMGGADPAAAPAPAVAAPQAGDDVTHLMPVPTSFALVNGKPVMTDAGGNTSEVDDPGFFAGMLHAVNPVPMIGHLAEGYVAHVKDAVANKQPPMDPLHWMAGTLVHGLVSAQVDQAKKVHLIDALNQGDGKSIAESVGHLIAAALPVIGPQAAQAGEDIASGKFRYGAGEAVGTLLPFGAAKLPKSVGLHLENANPAVRDAVDFGLDHNIPVDAGTATGNIAVKSVGQLAEHSSLAGAFMGGKARAAADAALARVGGELADQAHPSEVMPEQAGEGVRDATAGLISQLHGQATTAYDSLRRLEHDPAHTETLDTAPFGSPAYQRLLGTLADGNGGAKPSFNELRMMRQIEAELDEQRYQRGALVMDDRENGSSHFAPGQANASVYHDIHEAAGNESLTGAEMRQGIRSTLESGKWNAASKAAYQVARKRVPKTGVIETPFVTPGSPLLGKQIRGGMLIDLEPLRSAVDPIRRGLVAEKKAGGMLLGNKAQALASLNGLYAGDRYVPLSVADGVLSDLKRLARNGSLPALRSEGQGVAAAAVKQLDRVVRARALRAGPDAIRALEQGRAATIAKYQIGDLYEQFRDEPVQLMRQLTAPRNSNIKFLKRVSEAAPQALGPVSRAYLQELLEKATQDGGFKTVHGEWSKLGRETKRILFGTGALPQDLDHFFLLAKKMAENPNPSGSAYVGSLAVHGAYGLHDPLTHIGYEIGSAALAKMLHSSTFVRLLTRGLRVPLSTPAAAATVTAEILKAAGPGAVQVAAAAGNARPSPAQAAATPSRPSGGAGGVRR